MKASEEERVKATVGSGKRRRKGGCCSLAPPHRIRERPFKEKGKIAIFEPLLRSFDFFSKESLFLCRVTYADLRFQLRRKAKPSIFDAISKLIFSEW